MLEDHSAQLTLSQDKKSVTIILADGATLGTWDTKEQAITAISNCYCRGNIGKKQRKAFLDQIKEASLSYLRKEKYEIVLLLRDIDLFARKLIPGRALNNPAISMCRRCPTGDPHAYIYDENGERFDTPIRSKEFGHVIINYLAKKGCILESDVPRLRKELADLNWLNEYNPRFILRN